MWTRRRSDDNIKVKHFANRGGLKDCQVKQCLGTHKPSGSMPLTVKRHWSRIVQGSLLLTDFSPKHLTLSALASCHPGFYSPVTFYLDNIITDTTSGESRLHKVGE